VARSNTKKRRASQRAAPPTHLALVPPITEAAKLARELVEVTVNHVDFVNPAIPTRISVESDGFHVQIDTRDRKTGEPCMIDLRWDLPPILNDREHALDWIYACVREAWVHELNEALFVDGKRRRELHDDQGRTIAPPDEAARSELDTFKVKLARFLTQDEPVYPQALELSAFKKRLAAFLMGARER